MARVEAVNAALSGGQTENIFKDYKFRMEELDGFRYRAMDAWRAVTKIAIREARLKEIKAEMLNSVKLKTHLADNPRDAQILRHDKALHTVRQQIHLSRKIKENEISKINIERCRQLRRSLKSGN